MDTSNNQDFKVIDLERSQHPEDMELAKQATEVMEALIEKLKPIFRYISAPIPLLQRSEEAEQCDHPNMNMMSPNNNSYRAVELITITPPGEVLFLHEQGWFFVGLLCSVRRHPKHYHLRQDDNTAVWKLVPFQVLVAAIEKALRQAEEKRQEHLASIQQRREQLKQILEILNN
jgi:hypothetical protein